MVYFITDKECHFIGLALGIRGSECSNSVEPKLASGTARGLLQEMI